MSFALSRSRAWVCMCVMISALRYLLKHWKWTHYFNLSANLHTHHYILSGTPDTQISVECEGTLSKLIEMSTNGISKFITFASIHLLSNWIISFFDMSIELIGCESVGAFHDSLWKTYRISFYFVRIECYCWNTLWMFNLLSVDAIHFSFVDLFYCIRFYTPVRHHQYIHCFLATHTHCEHRSGYTHGCDRIHTHIRQAYSQTDRHT